MHTNNTGTRQSGSPRPNLMITGIPGTGKATLTKGIAATSTRTRRSDTDGDRDGMA